MTAILKPVGLLKSYIGGQAEVTVPAGPTVRQTLQDCGIPVQLVAIVIVNGDQQEKDYEIKEGDVIQAVAVVGGG